MNVKPVAEDLTFPQRWVFGIFGALLLIAAAVLLYRPPTSNQFPPQCAAASCLTDTASPPTSLIVTLVALGSLFALLAINGRRLSSVKFAGMEAQLTAASASAAKRELERTPPKPEEEEVQAEPPADTMPTTKPADTITVGSLEYELYSLGDLPIRVIKDALANIDPVLPGTLSRIEFIARRSGRGNHPWLLKSRDQEWVWRVSYGGQGKGEATVTRLE